MAITTAKALRRSIEDSNRHLSQLKLELGESSCLAGLTTEIRKLRTARHVVISSEEDTVNMEMSEPPNWMSDDAQALLDAVAALRGVEEIQLVDLGITFGPQGPRFPVRLLTRLLRKRGRGSLKRLVLSVRLWGDSTDFQQLADCLAHQHSLVEVAWEEWCFPSSLTTDAGDDDPPFDFDPIVAALAHLPQLESLSIKAMTAGSRRANLGTLSASTMEALGNHSSLRELQLVHFQLPNKTVQALARALSNNNSSQLQLLSLDLSKTGSMGAMKFFDSLACHSTTTITDLQIWASTHLSWAQDDCLEHLASKVLTVNTSLQSVSILTHSRTLQEAVQNLTVVNHRIAAAFVRMLETNCTLQHLVLDDYGDNDNATISSNDESSTLLGILRFYLALNGSKRREHLLQEYDTYTQRDWTDLLTMATDQSDQNIRLEALYYFLRLNPSLCQF